MLDLTTSMFFLAATLALNVTPGPDMLYVVARSVSEGRKAGIVSALGIAAGCLVHTFAIAAGLSGLLMAVPLAFEVVKLTGAAYLLYLGVRALLSRDDTGLAAPTVESARLWAIFRQGVVTNVLNPKVALFFLAFLPQFVDPKRGPVSAQLVLLGFLFNASGTLVNTVVALVSSGAGRWTKRRAGSSTLFKRATGLVFVGLGLRLALLERK
ncbi:LysE family translocator [Cystobacter fuscus]|uniref:LysE family translocator n=1 Tax=Cystobacter fuscus TaxID=43 RepID=UPI002B3155C6|nr:LysE family translocator [Cystobacter fuscus]